MRQAIYRNNPLILIHSDQPIRTKTAKPGAGIVRWIACKWELLGVLTLIGASAIYSVDALANLGL